MVEEEDQLEKYEHQRDKMRQRKHEIFIETNLDNHAEIPTIWDHSVKGDCWEWDSENSKRIKS